MKYGIYSFRDIKMGFMQPFYQQNDQVARRSANIALNDKNSNFFNIRNDIEVWKLGEFDDEMGVITPELTIIAGANELLREKNAE